VLRNSLIYSRKTAILTAIGIALGCLVHVSYTLFGLGLIIKETAWLFWGVKCVGAAYLCYIGFKGLRAKKTSIGIGEAHRVQDISMQSALWSGFLTNALNPKCMLFFISLFSVIISPNTPVPVTILYAMIIFVETTAWFSFVAYCLTGKKTRKKFSAFSHWIECLTGGVLVSLGVKLFFTV
jgi:RhtB (resistance to homoserine/threonine) family protein